jgi:hypothetical protein
MSTKWTIWLGADEKGRDCHLYWELAERTPKAAPIFMEIEADGKEASFRCRKRLPRRFTTFLLPMGRGT